MKKIVLIFIFLVVIVSETFAQASNETNKIHNGDLSLLSETISDISLAEISNSDLRLLRNMIYAKHGHIFKSEDLKNFFSQFYWYKTEKDVPDSDLSDEEMKLIKRIKIFENRDENLDTIIFGDRINGVWHRSPIMPDTWLDRFVFYPNAKLDFLVSNFIEDPEISEYIGNYVIKGNTLIFYVGKEVKRHISTELPEKKVLKFPITNISQVSFMNGELIRERIQIGSSEYFLVPGDPRKG